MSTADPLFLTLDQALILHEEVLNQCGGEAGVLNQGLLESAVNAPQATYGGRFLNEYPFEMAAAYLLSFARNHAFIDGNKRTAWAVANVFLLMNGYTVHFPSAQEAVTFVESVATGSIKKQAAAVVLKQYANKA